MSQPARPDPVWALAPATGHPRRPELSQNTDHRHAGGSPWASRPAPAINPMATGSAATGARPQISARLPVSDWQIRWRLQPDGQTVLEVTDQAGDLTGLVASTRLPIMSVDGAWRGTCSGADGTQQRWALAHRPRQHP